MTTEEITVPAERTETVDVCDECRLDEESANGDLVPFDPPDTESAEVETLHFHESCLEERFDQDGLSRPLGEAIATHPATRPDFGVYAVLDKADYYLIPVVIGLAGMGMFLLGSGASLGLAPIAIALGVFALVAYSARKQFDTEVFQ